jgi:hypothetical protein
LKNKKYVQTPYTDSSDGHHMGDCPLESPGSEKEIRRQRTNTSEHIFYGGMGTHLLVVVF